MSNAVAVGKRLGVKPILARRTAAAGRNGRRMRTGDAENAHAVIGKGPRRSTSPDEVLRDAEKHRRTTRPETWPASHGDFGKAAPGTNGLGMLVPAMRGQARNSLVPQTSASATGQQKGSKLAAFGGTKPATAGMSGTTATSTGSAGTSSSGAAATGVGKGVKRIKLERLPTGASGSHVGRRYRQGPKDDLATDIWDALTKKRRTEGGNVRVIRKALNESQRRRLFQVGRRMARGPAEQREHMGDQSMRHLRGITDSRNERAWYKGVDNPSAGLPRAARRRGITTEQFSDEISRRARHGGPDQPKARTLSKRRYDPEDERRHRQGALAAGSGLGGAALVASGGREVVRDTKGVRRARTDLDPGHPPMARAGEWRSGGRLRKPTPQESLGELMAHDKDMKSYGARLDAYRKLRNPKGAVVTGRAAGKVGAGLALLGAGAQLHRQRREPRFD